MTNQVFRSGKPVTAHSIVSAAIAGDMTVDEAVELVQLLIEARARGLDVREAEPRSAKVPSRGSAKRSAAV
ncbi:hypothetical protein ABEG10_37595 (plasmid) [Burkholderia cenocepacia]|uniref:hypothetical protein n=1 Tax=Burkholderia cepacia complex TaxID=87882 RepID=UPI0020A06A1A|nr:hypothetical protein [Burkholderia cenocepacia]MCO8325663.1 hypothetical protein [Burkholderia cenocepacia]MCO8332733.1 hypothetical protein [Burkholderia cenocepacia]MCO8340233.1 hypothetical protein [Burkholderia cenocepacia]MCO8347519.1 hypothetical protein [Burkholderia cenocepacia]MCO8360585.1 hypothetical protein [Burkholderia cenocepacia]